MTTKFSKTIEISLQILRFHSKTGRNFNKKTTYYTLPIAWRWTYSRFRRRLPRPRESKAFSRWIFLLLLRLRSAHNHTCAARERADAKHLRDGTANFYYLKKLAFEEKKGVYFAWFHMFFRVIFPIQDFLYSQQRKTAILLCWEEVFCT